MSDSVDISREYSFSSSIDLPSVLERQGIQYLDVDDQRAIVIFVGTILGLESIEGELTDLERAEITVYDHSLDRDAENKTEAAIELIEDFRNELSTSECFCC